MEEEETAAALLLSYSSQHLARRDIANCRLQALSAQRSNPDYPGPAQILAIADVLLAAGRRPRNRHLDWYSILQVQKNGSIDDAHLKNQFRKLLHLLNPTRNKFPLCRDALNLVADAWRVLSDPVARAIYDKKAVPTSTSFYTVCPYWYYMYEYEMVYRDYCLRCQTCGRAFHAVPITAPPPEAVVVVYKDGGGKEEGYRVQIGRFPLLYRLSEDELKDKKGDVPNSDNVVVISSDDEEEQKEEKTYPEIDSEIPQIPKRKKFKKIAWSATKISGRGVRIDPASSSASGNQKVVGDQYIGFDHGFDVSGDEKMDGVVTGSENEISDEGGLRITFDGEVRDWDLGEKRIYDRRSRNTTVCSG